MADSTAPTATNEPTASNWWALGFLFFAVPVMVMVGVLQIFQGLAAIVNGGFYVKPPHYAFQLDPTVWGWIHLLLGVLMAATGVYLSFGKPWARIMAIILALVSAVANFLSIPHYPVWSLVIIALDVIVIWAVVTSGRELQEMMA